MKCKEAWRIVEPPPFHPDLRIHLHPVVPASWPPRLTRLARYRKIGVAPVNSKLLVICLQPIDYLCMSPFRSSCRHNDTFDIMVKIGDTIFPNKAHDIDGGYLNSKRSRCLTHLLGANATNANRNAIGGVPMRLNAYTIFDYSNGGRTGFAKLVKNGKVSHTAPIDIAETAKE